MGLRDEYAPWKAGHSRAATPPTDSGTRSTTGSRILKLAATRHKGSWSELVDGHEAWLPDVIGKGGELRTMMIFDDIKTLLKQHRQDMDAADLGF